MIISLSGKVSRSLFVVMFSLALLACSSPQWQPAGDDHQPPKWDGDSIIASDGYRLPVHRYRAQGKAWAAIIALHGFNDYSHAFEGMCRYISRYGVDCFAYDQRGFGETRGRGLWPKEGRMQQDMVEVVKLVRQRMRGTEPLYVAGESMGGAVAISAAVEYYPELKKILSGMVLYAPAVWARHTQPWYQRAALWLAVHVAPDWKPTGKGLGVVASDNREALIAMGRDPLVIKATRIDTIFGLTNLMDKALQESPEIKFPTLIFYGRNDQVIPKVPVCEMIASMASSDRENHNKRRLVYYDKGYHMLTRDLEAETVFADMLAWVRDKEARMPSGEELSFNDWNRNPCPLYDD